MATSIDNPGKLEEWLLDQRQAISAQIAARIALAAIPAISDHYADSLARGSRNRLLLFSLRAASLAWSMSFGYERARAAAAAAAAARAAARAAADVDADVAARAAAAAAARAAAAASAAADAAAAANAAVDQMWRMITQEVAIIENWAGDSDGAGHALGRAPLPLIMETEWRRLRAKMLEADQNWSVWINWYEDRLAGKPQNRAFEQALLSLADEDWALGPEEVNALLAAKLGVGEQRIAGRIFEFENGRQVSRPYPFEFRASASFQSFIGGLRTQIKDYVADISGEYGESRFGKKVLRSLAQLEDCIASQQIDVGGILQLIAVMQANRLSMDSPDGNISAPDDLKNDFDALIANLFQLLALFGDEVAELKARAEALKLDTNDFNAIDDILRKIIEALRQRPDIIGPTVTDALQESIDRAAIITAEIEERKAAQDIAGAMSATRERTAVQSQHLLNQRNQIASLLSFFGSQAKEVLVANKKGFLKANEKGAEAVTSSLYVLLIAQVSPLLAGLVALKIFDFKPLSDLAARHTKKTEGPAGKPPADITEA